MGSIKSLAEYQAMHVVLYEARQRSAFEERLPRSYKLNESRAHRWQGIFQVLTGQTGETQTSNVLEVGVNQS